MADNIPTGKTHHPTHQIVQKSGRVSLDDLKRYNSPEATKHAKCFIPNDCKISQKAVTVKRTSKALQHNPDLIHKLSAFTGKSEEKLNRILERVILQNQTDYPFCTIGRVFVGWNNSRDWLGSGTGVLVGPNVMLTASHVAPWDKQGTWMRFVPGYNNGNEPLGSSYVSEYYGVDFATETGIRGYDYVVCHLNDYLGDTLGYMGSVAYGDDRSYQNDFYTSVGYPGNDMNDAPFPFIESMIYINDVDGDSDVDGYGTKKLEVDNIFSSHGWSGGPLWANYPSGSMSPHVVGVVTGYEKESFWFVTLEEDDVAAGGAELVHLIQWARDEYGIGSISQS